MSYLNRMKRYTLLELHKSVKSLFEKIGADFWIMAEVAQVSRRQHVYLELVQKEEGGIVAKARANLWAYKLGVLQDKLGRDTLDQLLKQGTKVLVKVTCTFHEVYSYSLTIQDLDPSYTLGELERKRQETIQRLELEGRFDQQRQLHLPAVIQRIAIISSAEAAGYTDFTNQLERNAYRYAFAIQLHEAAVQGERALVDIPARIAALSEAEVDAIVLIRGGGSRLDLQVFDEYAICQAIADSPIPVLTGIGHERDTPVADLVAHTRLKTPTAVAEFLIQRMLEFETELLSTHDQLTEQLLDLLRDHKKTLADSYQQLFRLADKRLQEGSLQLSQTQSNISQSTRYLLRQEQQTVDHLHEQIRLLSPDQVLARGYSITTLNGKPIQAKTRLNPGDQLITLTQHSEIESEIKTHKPRS